MAIKIYNSSIALPSPVITLTGMRYNIYDTYARRDRTATTITCDHNFVSSGHTSGGSKSYRKEDIYVFYKYVDVNIIPSKEVYQYGRHKSYFYTRQVLTGAFVGKNKTNRRKVALRSNTYYTLSGKDPVRGASYLYQNEAFRIDINTAGCNNIILKARTYYQGKVGDITGIRLRIVRGDKIDPRNLPL